MERPLRILMVEDSAADAEVVQYELTKGGLQFEVRQVDNREAFEESLGEFAPDIILSDFSFPVFDGMSALEMALERCPDVPFVFVSGAMGEDFAVDMLRCGATDYVLKQKLSRLVPAVRRALAEAEERRTRERAEAELMASGAKFRAVFASTGTAMCVIDETDVIAETNREFVQMFGREPGGPAGGRCVTELLVPEQHLLDEFRRRHLASTLDPSVGAARFETRVLDREGRELSVLVSIGAIPGTGESVVSFIDVSKEQVYEQELRESADRLREFLIIASHEIRHPITIITAYSALLDRRGSELAPELVKEIYGHMSGASERLGRIVSELMDVSRIESVGLRVEMQPVDLEALIAGAIEDARVREPDRVFTLEAEGGLWSVSLDPFKFRDLLLVLLDNAVTYSPKTSPVDVTAGITGDVVTVTVLDRGPGIAEEHREKVFERFYQVEDTMHHSAPGLGLGLYMAQQIVAAHGGKILCEERSGGGAAFRVELPLGH